MMHRHVLTGLVVLMAASCMAIPLPMEGDYDLNYVLNNLTALWEEVGKLRHEVEDHQHGYPPHDQVTQEVDALQHEMLVHAYQRPHEGHNDHHDPKALQHLEHFHEHHHDDHDHHGGDDHHGQGHDDHHHHRGDDHHGQGHDDHDHHGQGHDDHHHHDGDDHHGQGHDDHHHHGQGHDDHHHHGQGHDDHHHDGNHNDDHHHDGGHEHDHGHKDHAHNDHQDDNDDDGSDEDDSGEDDSDNKGKANDHKGHDHHHHHHDNHNHGKGHDHSGHTHGHGHGGHDHSQDTHQHDSDHHHGHDHTNDTHDHEGHDHRQDHSEHGEGHDHTGDVHNHEGHDHTQDDHQHDDDHHHHNDDDHHHHHHGKDAHDSHGLHNHFEGAPPPNSRPALIGPVLAPKIGLAFAPGHEQGAADQGEEWVYASCKLEPNAELPGATVRGNVILSQKKDESGPVFLHLDLEGFQSSQGRVHGFHIHSSPITDNKCSTAGGHWNPFDTTHGGPDSNTRHVGDLGNIEVDSHGRLEDYFLTDDQIAFSGPATVIAKSIVIHAGEDDLGLGGDSGSLSTGNAGGRLACCTIHIQAEASYRFKG